MPKRINVVVTCTKRKLLDVPPERELSGFEGTVRERARQWVKMLRALPGEGTPARQVYAGDHWATVRSFPKAAERGGLAARVWVLSAGYGLIPWDARIHAYSATFSADHPDSVCRVSSRLSPSCLRAEWWNSLAVWAGPEENAPRTLAALAKSEPSVPVLVAASDVYLSAVQEDLLEARDQLTDSDLLSVVSAGCDGLGQLTDHLIPADARLKQLLGGGMQSLNVRIARKILEEAKRWAPRQKILTRRFRGLLSKQEEFVQPKRVPMSDREVRAYVLTALKDNPKITRTPLLRRLRDSGKACEQRRFGSLFLEVVADFNKAHVQEKTLHGT